MIRILFQLAAGLAALIGAGMAPAQEASVPPVYEVPALNPQLGLPPEGLDRATPRATVAGLLERVAAGEVDAAAHYLNLTDADLSPVIAARRAAQLASVIERAVSPDWSRLTDRPDGLLDTTGQDAAQAGEPRRSILLGRVEMADRGVPIRVNRVAPPGGPPVWVFAQGTVAEIPAMHARHGPSALELALPERLRAEAQFGLMWWEVLALPLALALTGLAAWAAWRFTSRLARGDRLGARLVRASRMPLALLAAAGTASLLLTRFFAFSAEISVVAQPLMTLGLALALLLFVLRAVDVVIEELVSFDDATLQSARQERRRAIATRISALRRGLLILFVGLALVFAFHEAQISGGFGLSLFASAGLLTLLLGFAARTILGNILASMQIALNQSARIGDKVLYKGDLAYVERLHFTFVQLRVWTGVRLIVPVSEFVSEPFENWTLQERPMKRLIRLRLAHGADIDALRQDFEEIMDTLDPGEMDDRSGAFVMVSDQDLFGIEVMFGLPCANPDTAWELSCAAREKLVAAAVRRERQGARMFAEAKASEAA